MRTVMPMIPNSKGLSSIFLGFGFLSIYLAAHIPGKQKILALRVTISLIFLKKRFMKGYGI
ncbi:MAG: hypothetical protein A2162_05430 [Deltaproteobacteria bacterium RBG_13_52_11b]|nr:MAG: hypothetical protein A2162_05430 [Deltaproteobacteria bacterium RBG_13_52_11b]